MVSLRETRAGRWGAVCAALLAAAAGGAAAPKALFTLEPVTARSTSGQFTVRGLPLGPPGAGRGTSEVSYLRLDPTLTAVSLERIRQALNGELGLPDAWKGPITVGTFPVVEDNPPVTVTSVKFAQGWGYRVEMPEVVDRMRFLRTAVNVLLLEYAHRTALAREVELPPWLAPGLAAELEATSLGGLAVEPDTGLARSAPRADPLQRVRGVVRDRGMLNVDQLSQPADVDAEQYAACAQLFVHELLRLRGGPDKMRDLLRRLPQHLNWQTAFLGAFAEDFPRLIDVDKWCLLRATHLAGRGAAAQWTAGVALERLEEVLATPVEVRTGAGSLPIQTTIRLQQVLGEWEFPRQAPVLEGKVTQLESLLPRCPAAVALLAAGYRQALQAYLQQRTRPARATKLTPAVEPRLVVHETLRKLDDLDRQREAARPAPAATTPAPSTPSPRP